MKLSNHLRSSKLCCPSTLSCPYALYFTKQCSDELKAWLDQAKMACDVHWAIMCDSYVKAQFQNQKNWRHKIAEADSNLDKQVLLQLWEIACPNSKCGFFCVRPVK